MKNSILPLVFISILFLFSCESDSDGDITNNSTSLPNVSIISKDDSNLKVFHIDITDDGETVVTSNLTDEIGLPFSYLNVSYENETISFFDRGLPELIYTVYEKNVNTGEINIYEDVCTQNQAINRVNRSDQKIILFTIESNTFNLYIQDKDTNACTITNFQNLDTFFFRFHSVDEETIYLYLYDEFNELKIISVELSTGNILNEMTLDFNSRVRIIGNSLYVEKTGSPLKVFNKNTFELQNELQVDNLPTANEYISKVENKGDNIIINVPLPAPSFSAFSPAIYDISTFEITKGGPQLYFDIRDNLADEVDIASNPIIYDVDVHSEIIALSFRDISGNYNLLLSNFDAEILKIVPLDKEPTEIFIH
jgi:hypothetical protein